MHPTSAILSYLGTSGPHLDLSWSHLGGVLGRLGPILGLSWVPLGPSWALQASPWGHPGPSLDFPRAPWCHLEPSWAHLGPNWSLWGAFLALTGTFLAPLGAVLELAWGHLGNIFGPNCCHVEAIGGSLHRQVYLSFSCLLSKQQIHRLEASSPRGASAGTRSAYNIA